MYAIIARMVAANRRLPVVPPNEKSALPSLSQDIRSLFRWAVQKQGDAEYTELKDASDLGHDEAEWIKLRQAHIGVLDPRPFSFSSTVTPSEIVDFVERCEQYIL